MKSDGMILAENVIEDMLFTVTWQYYTGWQRLAQEAEIYLMLVL